MSNVVVLQPGPILVQRPIIQPGGLAQAGVRQIVVQRPASLQQLRPGQLIATQQPTAVPRIPLAVNTVQPVPAASASMQNPPKKGLSLTVCDSCMHARRHARTHVQNVSKQDRVLIKSS